MMPSAPRVTALIIGLALLAPLRLVAQHGEDEVLAAVHQLFQAMRARDTVALRAVFDSTADLVTTAPDGQGGFTTRRVAVDDFVTSIGRLTVEVDERIHDPEVRIDGGLASVWAPYDVYVNGTLSHCGVDAFHLTRASSGWRIVAVADTRRREGCSGPVGGR